MVDLVQIACVEGVLKAGSFRGAAREVHLSQPAVSAHVSKLERELGISLFERGRGVTRLTLDGERVLPHLRAFTASAAAIHEASNHLKAGVAQTLTVYSYRTGLNDILPAAFRVLSESFDPIRTRMTEATREVMVSGLLGGACDLALDAQIGEVVDHPGVDVTVLLDVGPTVLIGRHGHPLLDDEGWIDAAEIGERPLVVQASLEPFLLPLLPEDAGRRLTLAHDAAATLALYDAGAELAIVSAGVRVVNDPAIRRRAIIGGPRVRCIMMKASGAILSPPAETLHGYLVSWGEHSRQNSMIDVGTGLWRRLGDTDRPGRGSERLDGHDDGE